MEWRLIKRAAHLSFLLVFGIALIGAMNYIIPASWKFGKPVFAQEFYGILRIPIVNTSTVRISPLPSDGRFTTSSNAIVKSQTNSSAQISRNNPNQLEEIRTGLHDGYCSIVLQFEDEISFEGPFIEGGTLSFKLKGVNTGLDEYLEYKNIHSWVRLTKDKNDVDVIVGIPPDFQSPRLFLLKNPQRLVVNFFPDNHTTKESTVLIKPVTISAPPVVSSLKEKETGAVSPYFREKIDEIDDQKETEVKKASGMQPIEIPSKSSSTDGEILKQAPQENAVDSKGSPGGKGTGFMAIGPTLLQGSNYQVRITPKISIREEYDDNIFLVNDNPDSDWITTVSPGIGIVIESNKNGLELDYTFGWVKYFNSTSNDNTRHSGRLKFWQQLAEHLKFNLEDRYLKSDDIFDEDLTPILPSQRVSNNRSRYQRNDAKASFEYEFGPKSKFIAGYLYNILDNEDPTLEDVTEKGPFAGLSHSFDSKNSIDFAYRFAEYEYTQSGSSQTRPDIEVQETNVGYSYRFSERIKPFLAYSLYHQNFMGIDQSYWIHNFGGGVGYAFSQKTSFDISLGGFYPSGNTTATPGMTFRAQLTRNFKRGSFSLGADTGWDTGFTEIVPRGFTKYYRGLARIDYQLLEHLGIYANTSYRQNQYPTNEQNTIPGYNPADDKTYTGRCGLNYRFYRWFSVDLSYTGCANVKLTHLRG